MSDELRSGEGQDMGRHQSIPPQDATATAQEAERIHDTRQQAEPAWMLEVACCCPATTIGRRS
jgi:hypothetical protein